MIIDNKICNFFVTLTPGQLSIISSSVFARTAVLRELKQELFTHALTRTDRTLLHCTDLFCALMYQLNISLCWTDFGQALI